MKIDNLFNRLSVIAIIVLFFLAYQTGKVEGFTKGYILGVSHSKEKLRRATNMYEETRALLREAKNLCHTNI